METRLAVLEQLGVDAVVAQWFTRDYLGITPQMFVKDWLKDCLDAKFLAAGFNYHFGSGKTGDAAMLEGVCIIGYIMVVVVGIGKEIAPAGKHISR